MHKLAAPDPSCMRLPMLAAHYELDPSRSLQVESPDINFATHWGSTQIFEGYSSIAVASLVKLQTRDAANEHGINNNWRIPL